MAKIPIILEPGRADGKLATSSSIFDENKSMFQSEINDIQDTLNSDNPNKPLSAKQGKVLKELLDTKVIKNGGVPIDTEPIEGNTTHVVTSDGIHKALLKKVDTIAFQEEIQKQDENISELHTEILDKSKANNISYIDNQELKASNIQDALDKIIIKFDDTLNLLGIEHLKMIPNIVIHNDTKTWTTNSNALSLFYPLQNSGVISYTPKQGVFHNIRLLADNSCIPGEAVHFGDNDGNVSTTGTNYTEQSKYLYIQVFQNTNRLPDAIYINGYNIMQDVKTNLIYYIGVLISEIERAKAKDVELENNISTKAEQEYVNGINTICSNLKITVDNIVGIEKETSIDLLSIEKIPYYIVGNTNIWYKTTSNLESSIISFYPNANFTIVAASSGIRFSCLKSMPIEGQKVEYCQDWNIKQVGGTFTSPNDCKFLYVLRTYSDGTDYTPTTLTLHNIKGELEILNDKIVKNVNAIATVFTNINNLEYNIKKPLILELNNATQEQSFEFPIKKGETWHILNMSDSGTITVYTGFPSHTEELVRNLHIGNISTKTVDYDATTIAVVGSIDSIKLAIFNDGVYKDIEEIKAQLDKFITTTTTKIDSKQEKLSKIQLNAVNSGINEELVSNLSELLPQSEKTYNVASTYNTRPGFIVGSTGSWSKNYSHYIIPIPSGVKSISIKQNNTSIGTMAYLKNDNFAFGEKVDFCDNYKTVFTVAQGSTFDVPTIPSDCKYIYFLHDIGTGDRTPESITFSATKGSIKTMQEDVEVLKKDVKDLKRCSILPERYNTEAERIYKLSSVDNHDFSICIFADPHSEEQNKFAKYKQVLDKGIVDCIIGLGDVESYKLIDKPKDIVIPTLTYLTSIAGRTDSCFYAIGNHDAAISSPNNGVLLQDYNLTKKEQFNIFTKHLSKSAVFDNENPYGAYYYSDFDASKIRIIVLNTSEIYEDDGSLSAKYVESVMIRQQQINWFINKALDFSDKENKEDWSVLCCGHSSAFNDIITEILNAFKNGINVTINKTLYRQLTNVDGNWNSPINNNAPYKISVNKDFSQQGSIDVIGVLYGHVHWDSSRVTNGIVNINFICDNGELDNVYTVDVAGITAGKYYISYGDHYLCIELGNYPNVTKIGFNKYLANNPSTACVLYDENGIRMETSLSWTNKITHDGYDIELSGFTPERIPDTITTESCKILSIDKTNRKIKIYSYGIQGYKELDY